MFMDQKASFIKMSLLPKVICRLNAIVIKIPTAFFTVVKMQTLKFLWNCKKLRSQNNFKKEQSWKIYTSHFQNLLKSYNNQKQLEMS